MLKFLEGADMLQKSLRILRGDYMPVGKKCKYIRNWIKNDGKNEEIIICPQLVVELCLFHGADWYFEQFFDREVFNEILRGLWYDVN